MLNEYLEDNLVLIVPNNIRRKIIKYINSLDKIYNIKVIDFNEVKRMLFFYYDEKTIFYLVNNKNLSYLNAIEYLDNMAYLIDDSYENEKLEKIVKLKNELLNNNLLYYNDFDFKKKKFLVYGYTLLNKWQLKLIELLREKTDVFVIENDNKNYKHDVLEFKNINDEIEFVINDILDKKIDLNHVFIANINDDYISTIKRIFNNYHININLKSKTSIYDTAYGLNFLNDLNLENVLDENIKNSIINILNKYYFIEDKSEIKDILTFEFKNCFLKKNKYKNAVNEIELKDNLISDEDYVYLIGFNREYIPKVYKDEDFINDLEKPIYLEKTYEKNVNEYKAWNNILSNIKNVTISYSKQNLKGSLNPSALINGGTLEMNYKVSHYSHNSNIYNLSLMLDEFIKYGTLNDNISVLINNYQDLNYLKYDNKFKKFIINKSNLSLSYTKLNTYYECGFKYYCDYVLKLKPYEQSFDAYAGSLCHYILSKCYDDIFDFDIAYNEFIKENKFELTLENKVFLGKMMCELKDVIKYLKEQYNLTLFKEIECEKNIEINMNGNEFVGIIDKVMKYDDKIVLVDYKTGETDIDLRLSGYGLKLQLPVYIYLIKKIYPNSKIVGIYLEHIISPIINQKNNKTFEEQINDNLKLCGYTLGNENVINEFDPTYENSDFIKGMSMTANGFSKNAKVLSESDFEKLANFTEVKIIEAFQNIMNANFNVNPKVKGIDNISCKYCAYKSVCFTNEKDNMLIKNDDELSFLGGDQNA